MKLGIPWRPVITAAAVALALALPAAVSAGSTTTECGIFREYQAPDPVAVTTGAIAFGVSGPIETIAADATLVPPTDTLLPSLADGAPTCLNVERDAGVITSLRFAPSGEISGAVVLVLDLFGPDVDGYVIADRLFAPVEIIEDNAGLRALIGTAAQSGQPLTLAFTIDLTTGLPTAFDGNVVLIGDVALLPGGDVRVGTARLPEQVIDADSLALLAEAAALGVEATVVVTGHGTPDDTTAGGVNMAITLSVSFEAPPTEPPPPTAPPTAPPTWPPLPDTATSAGAGDHEVGAAALYIAVLLAALGAMVGFFRKLSASPTR